MYADPAGGTDSDAGRRAVAREVDVLRRRRDAAPILVGCATGIAASCPTIFTAVLRLSMSTATRWRSRMRAKSCSLAR